MPAEKAFSITEIIDILHNYDFSKQRRLSFEYIVFKGVNDSLIYAKEIVKLLRGIECRVNLIRFHAIPNVDLEGVDMETMVAFRDYLTQHGHIIMKRIAFYLSLVLVVLVLASCKKGQKNLFTPTSSGRPYEVLVVVNKPVWDRPAGRALFDVLDTNVPGLPQAERSFRISNVDPQHFDRVLKIFRNIIIVDIQDIYTQPKLKFSRDVYASPQMIMTIQAPNEDEFEEFVAKNSKVIIDFFVKAEMNRQIALLKQKHSDVISTKVGSIFDCDIWVPVELANYKEGKDFLWASTNRATADMNFVMYSYPYTDKDTFTKDYFIHKRDSVMKANIPGEREGMYMATDSMFVDVEDIVVKGEYAQEARGLWEMEGDMMGGPFVSHARVDRANGRVVVVEAFIYSPDKLKRNLMRQMEASLYTLRLPNESLIDEIVISGNIPEEKIDTTSRVK